ncbi:MAG: glycerol kinase GlpK [Micavibrio sp.]|nr:glycerol kinase GlpK [Micavibrio sp.]
MGKTLLAIDQGTTSSRAILFDDTGSVLDVEQKELEIFCPHNGWVEQDANAIFKDTLYCIQKILERAENSNNYPVAAGITSQRETTIVWDKKTGEPVYNAIVWQDRRTSEFCSQLKGQGLEDMISAITGLLIDPYFSASKVNWIVENVEGVRARAENGDILFGTVESWLHWNLTGGENHFSDITNASRTLLYNIVEQKWDEELLRVFNVPKSMLPEVKDNVFEFGSISSKFVQKDIPILSMVGDQQAALIGQACFKKGMVKSTYGTGCFALMNVGTKFVKSESSLLTTPAYRINGEITYALEGSIFIAGAAVQWLRDGLQIIDHANETQDLAQSIEGNNGVYFVPSFTGLGAPHWKPDARGMICGLGRDTTRAHIVRAALEAQAYQTQDLLTAIEADAGCVPRVIRVDGGLVANDFVCQFLADIVQKTIEVPKVREATAWGAAALAGFGASIYQSLDDINDVWQKSVSYTPEIDVSERDDLHGLWLKAVKMVDASCK